MCAIIKNPLQRDGTSQQQRMAKILLPENAKIDDRSIEEIIAFACEYIKLINYYNAANQTDPNTGWSCFYEGDVCILLAVVAATDTESIEASFKELEEKITQLLLEKEQGELDETEAENLTRYYDDIINLIYSVAARIQYTCTRLPNGHALKEEIITIIKNDLHLAIIDNKQQDALIKLIGYDKASVAPVNDYTYFIQTENNNGECARAWQLDQEGYDCIFPDTSFDIASLKVLFYIFFIALLRIKQRAAFYFEDCIKNTDTHQPHITLFLTFLYLFRNATDHLNTLTRSHLLYYYETILCLHKKAATPDKVHIIFELAKNFDTHLVEEGTLLNAGKDDTGKQMVYALLEEVVVNKAKVEELKTVYIKEETVAVTVPVNGVNTVFQEQTSTVYPAPVANSKNGIGETFSKEEQVQWKSLGGTENDAGEVGFALASPMFMLSEGIRDIRVTFTLDQIPEGFEEAITPFLHASFFRLKYSNGQDWVEMDDVSSALLNSFFVNNDLTKYGQCFDLISAFAIPGSAETAITKTDIKKIARAKRIKASASAALKEDDGDEDAFQEEAEGAQKTFYHKIDFTKNTIDFLLHINEFAPPFTFIELEKNKKPIRTPWPVLKIFIRNDEFNNRSAYTVLKGIRVKNIDIKSDIKAVKNLTVQNDTAILNPSREFFPFGIRPKTGSGFYIGSNEVFQKKIDRLDIALEWANLPLDIVKDEGEDEFGTYYRNYILSSGITTVTNAFFTVSVDYLYNRAFTPLLTGVALFTNDAALPSDQKRLISDAAVIKNFARFPSTDLDLPEYKIDTQRGFIRLRLDKSFFHDEYSKSLIKGTIIESAKGDGADGSSLPNEPFIPTLKNVSLNYASSLSVEINTPVQTTGVTTDIYEELFHVVPFGYKQIDINKKPLVQEPVLPVPQFNYAAAVEDFIKFTQGNLYIGLKDAKAEQKVNVLFQVLDGSGDNRYSPPDIEWDYLINNEWFPFQPFEIQDHTRADESSKKSLLKSGIIEFTLPKSISSTYTTILNAGLLWIRACAHEEVLPVDPNLIQSTQRIAALPDLVAVIAQAGIAQFEDQGNSLNHLAVPLPGKTISKFMDSRAAIKTVSQPYNSFDGRMPENDYQFYRRISERLRHKNRAICIWDYERLVLEQFPALYKVKCLNHTSILENKEIAPGFVSIAVIPDLRNRNTVNTTEPRVPIGVLDEIKVFLQKQTNLFVSLPFTTTLEYLQVVNPLYEQLKVTCCVRFYQGLDPAYYKYVLNSDLKNFLAPWAYNTNSEISFGFAYHKSAILNFIEERKYVDVVLDFKVQHFKDTIEQPASGADWIIPTTSRSILTTVDTIDNSDYEHDISVASYTEDEPCKDCDDEGTATKVLPALKKVKQ